MWLKRTARRTSVASAPASWQVLLDAGLIDVEFFGALVGRRFDGPDEAGAHLVQTSQHHVPPHPLLDPSFLPEHPRRAWNHGDFAETLRHLSGPEGLTAPWSSLFDPRRLFHDSDVDLDDEGRWRRVTAFLGSLTDDVVLPVVPDLERTVTWGEARTALMARGRSVRRARRDLMKDRTAPTFDTRAEEAWLAEAGGAPLPEVGGPLVSVVMPVWNRSDIVAAAVRSVQEQTLRDWELIVVDDGSDDDSVAVLERLAAVDDRIVVVRRSHAGVCAARNAGLERARGRYVAFLDSDNSWRPHYLETMVRAMSRDGLRLAYAAASLRNEGEVVYRAHRGGLDHLLHFNHIDLNVLMLDAELAREVDGFDTALRRWVDHDFAIRAARIVTPVLLPFIGCDYHDERSDEQRITTTESDHWQWVVLGKAWVDWERLEGEADARVPGRTSVVIPTYQDARMTREAVASVLDTTRDEDVEVLVVDNGSRLTVSVALEAAFLGADRVRVIRLHRNLNFAIGSNVGLAESTGEHVLFLNNDTTARPGWLPPLRKRLSEPGVIGVQPLLLYPDETIQAAGTVFPVADGLPVQLAAGLAREDAAAAGRLEWDAVTAAATLYAASTVIRLRGFDPMFVNGMEDVDLCLRAREQMGGHFAVEPDSVFEHHESRTPGRGDHIVENRALFLDRWRGRLPGPQPDHYEAFGLEVIQIGLDRQPVAAPLPVTIRRRPAPVVLDGRLVPVLRWSLKAPVPAGRESEGLPALVVAERLADSLRRLGQEVVVMRREAHNGPASAYDDVAVVLRDDEPAYPQSGRVNLLWAWAGAPLRSSEAAGFDEVFGAELLVDEPDAAARVLLDVALDAAPAAEPVVADR